MANLIKLPGETVEATEDVTVIVAASFQGLCCVERPGARGTLFG